MDEYDKRHNINIGRYLYRCNRENGRENFGKHNDGWNRIWVMVSGSMFYRNSVVGEVVYLINDIYGGRTSLFLTSQRMPAATDAYTRIYNYVNIYTPSVASGTQLMSTTHFSCRRNIVGRLCIRPTIVCLIFQIKQYGLGI